MLVEEIETEVKEKGITQEELNRELAKTIEINRWEFSPIPADLEFVE